MDMAIEAMGMGLDMMIVAPIPHTETMASTTTRITDPGIKLTGITAIIADLRRPNLL
jgi:hypothetical protein